MKTVKFTILIFVIASSLCSNEVVGQTVQFELRSSFENYQVPCLERPIAGEFVYHFTYHIDKKAGKVDRIHWNTAQSEVWDYITGERYIPIDKGDAISALLMLIQEMVNEINENIEWLYEEFYLPTPEDWPTPTINSFVNMNYRFIGERGSKFTMKLMWQLHMNANGVITAEKYAEYADCYESEQP